MRAATRTRLVRYPPDIPYSEAAGDIFPSESHGIIVGDQKIVVGVVESPTETYHEFPTALHGLMADCGPLKDVVVLGSIDDVRPAFFSAPVAAPATFHSSGATDITTTPLPALIVSVTADLLQFSKTVCSDPAALQSRISQQHHFLPAVETCTRIMDTPGPMRLGVWMDVYCTPLRLELASERAE